MTALGVAPAKPICLTCISSPFAGAAVNTNTEASNEYALVPFLSVGCCTTPLTVTIILSLFAGICESVKSVALPLPVKLSNLLSLISNVGRDAERILPQNISAATGATLNTIFSLSDIPNPSVNVAVSFALCTILLIATVN